MVGPTCRLSPSCLLFFAGLVSSLLFSFLWVHQRLTNPFPHTIIRFEFCFFPCRSGMVANATRVMRSVAWSAELAEYTDECPRLHHRHIPPRRNLRPLPSWPGPTQSNPNASRSPVLRVFGSEMNVRVLERRGRYSGRTASEQDSTRGALRATPPDPAAPVPWSLAPMTAWTTAPTVTRTTPPERSTYSGRLGDFVGSCRECAKGYYPENVGYGLVERVGEVPEGD